MKYLIDNIKGFTPDHLSLKRSLISLVLVLALIMPGALALADDITNADYYATLTATNNSTAAGNVAAVFSANTTMLQNNWDVAADLSDISIRDSSGNPVYFQPSTNSTNPWVFWAGDFSAFISKTFTMYFPDVTGGLYRLFGSFSISDNNTTLGEPSDNHSIRYTVRLGEPGGLVRKHDALALTWGTDNVTYSILTNSWVSYTKSSAGSGVWVTQAVTTASANDFRIRFYNAGGVAANCYIFEFQIYDDAASTWLSPDSIVSAPGWSSSGNAIDGNTGTGALDNINASAWSDFITVRFDSPVTTSQVRFYVDGASSRNIGTGIYASIAAASVSSSGSYAPGDALDINIVDDSPFLSLNPDGTATPPVTDNLTLNAPLWQVESDNATFTTIDSNALTGTVTNAVWSSSGYTFDGTDDNIDFGSGAVLDNLGRVGNYKFSVVAWVNPATLGENNLGTVIEKGNIVLRVQGTATAQFAITVGAAGKTALAPNSSVPLGSPTMLTGVYDGTNVLLYTNTTKTTGSAATGAIDDHSASSFLVGDRTLNDRCFNGTIGQIIVYNEALSAAQVTQIYNATKSKYTTGDIYTYSTSASVPDNANPIIVGGNGSIYSELFSLTIGGVEKARYAYEYSDSVLTDLTGNGNDAAFIQRTASTDPDVSVTISGMQPINQASSSAVPGGSWPDMITSVPDEPDNMTDSTSRPAFFFEPLVHELLAAGGVPDAFFWYNFCFVIIIGAGMVMYRIYPSLAVKGVLMGALMAWFASGDLNVYGFWTLLFFGFYSIGVIIASRSWGL